jgi:hypothetical protein
MKTSKLFFGYFTSTFPKYFAISFILAMSIAFIIFIFVSFCSCSPAEYINPPKFSSIEEAHTFIVKNIIYVRDDVKYGVEDYWQTPEETINCHTGDCEDKAILFMYILKTQFYIESYLEIVNTGGFHAIIRVSNTLYDSTSLRTGTNIEGLVDKFIYELHYEATMWRASYFHK